MPLLAAVLGLGLGIYGRDGERGGCWIADGTLRLAFFYVPLWAVIAFNAAVYWTVSREFRRALRRHGHSLAPRAGSGSKVHRLKYYPAVLAWTWLFGTVDRVCEACGRSYFALALLHHGFGRSQGLWNCVVYGTDPMQEFRATLIAQLCGGHRSDAAPDAAEAAAADGAEMSSKAFDATRSAAPASPAGAAATGGAWPAAAAATAAAAEDGLFGAEAAAAAAAAPASPASGEVERSMTAEQPWPSAEPVCAGAEAAAARASPPHASPPRPGATGAVLSALTRRFARTPPSAARRSSPPAVDAGALPLPSSSATTVSWPPPSLPPPPREGGGDFVDVSLTSPMTPPLPSLGRPPDGGVAVSVGLAAGDARRRGRIAGPV